jgi:hypothetical protein
MERDFELVLLDRLSELRHSKDELIEEIDGLNIIINHFTNFRNDPDYELYLKAKKELPVAELQLKNLVQQFSMLEKRYRIDYLPETLPEDERYIIYHRFQFPKIKDMKYLTDYLELTEIFLIN